MGRRKSGVSSGVAKTEARWRYGRTLGWGRRRGRCKGGRRGAAVVIIEAVVIVEVAKGMG